MSQNSNYFPLWIVTYWRELNHVAEHRQCWVQAKHVLRQLHTRGPELVDAVHEALSHLPWYGSVQGFSKKDNILHLHKFATTKWLSTVHENQMLDLLRFDISQHCTDSESWAYNIESTEFVPSLITAFDRRYTFQRGPLHNLAQSLVSGVLKCVGTILNSQDTHWAALVLDFSSHIIWYGDSLGWQMEARTKDAISWWIQAHTLVPFIYKMLPITYQEDTFSCGLLAWNSLTHYFLPAQNPLVDPSLVAIARLKVLLRISTHHLDQVG